VPGRSLILLSRQVRRRARPNRVLSVPETERFGKAVVSGDGAYARSNARAEPDWRDMWMGALAQEGDWDF
jgi:hypothetical protein